MSFVKERVSRLIASLDHPDLRELSALATEVGWVRDALIIYALGERDTMVLKRIALDSGEHTGQEVGRILAGRLLGAGDPPDFASVERMIRMLEGAPESAGVDAVLAYLHWITGHEAQAVTEANKAATLAPSMPMPVIVASLIRDDIRPTYLEQED